MRERRLADIYWAFFARRAAANWCVIDAGAVPGILNSFSDTGRFFEIKVVL
ncbi:MAG: hypothetical protein ACLP7P_12370 [Rhodomicrobium sp.]